MQQQVLHAMLATCQTTRFRSVSISMKTTAYFRDVVRQKHPGIAEAWIMRVLADPPWRNAARPMAVLLCGGWCRRHRTVRSGSLILRTE
jgi:hypothetical protein